MAGLGRPVFGQRTSMNNEGDNLPNYDARPLHYGFYIAGNYSSFRVDRSNYFVSQLDGMVGSDTVINPITHINGKGFGGFTLGFVMNLNLTEHLDLRFTPGASFYQRQVEYTFRDTIADQGTNESIQLEKTIFSFIEFPLMLKFKSVRRQNVRLYMLAGIRPSIEVGAKRNETSPNNLQTRGSDFSIEYGFGADLYYPLFKFSPELRFSHGISDMTVSNGNRYDLSLNKLFTHTVTLYLYFE
ncbi:porin family protein [Catalinimonas alkaloidigena]|nr:porin family protein [Catalinimonas alkaloidigena]